MGYEELDTPSVIVDVDLLERNIAEMAAVARAAGVQLRPHIKTHKSPRIARMQLEAGAVGITCAKLGEAEVMAEGGITDIFVCYPLVTAMKVRRLAALARRPGMTVSTIVDSPEGVAVLSSIFAGEPAPLEVLVKVDAGLGRVGVAPGDTTVALAQRVADAPGLRFGGICMHEGQTYKYPDSEERAEAGRAAARSLIATARALDAVGLPPARVSSGSTPGGPATASVAGITEMRPGNYAFYDAMQVGLNVVPPERCALRVLVTVVSHTARDRAVMD
ncbi:MAG: alanine racemase, partial [Thermomicrobia bacterium]|nr:alanine racemase [Thermomicrobia bacterium]